MEGAKLQAHDISLDAARNLHLIAATNTTDVQSTNSGSNVGLGATLGSNGQQTGLSFQIGASASKGHTNGHETTYDNTQISATNHLRVKSGGDLNMIGAQLAGNKVNLDIGGNLNILTQQDISNFDSKQENGGFSLSLCIPPICVGVLASGGVSYARQTVDHNYRSAVGQSGIAAGKGGFDINVKGNTDLTGAAITSQAEADKNSLHTASLTSRDLVNTQHTDAESISVSLSTGSIASNVMGNVLGNLSGIGMPKSGDDRSNTNSVISPATVTITGSGDATTDANSKATANTLTERDATTANATLSNTLTLQQAQDLQLQQQQAQDNQRIAGLVGAVLTNMVGDLAQGKWPDGSPQKIALHGIVGLIEAKIGGGSAAAGLAAGMMHEAMVPVLSDYLISQGYEPGTQDFNDMMSLGASLVGAASGALAGGSVGDAGIGANVGVIADANNRQMHPAEVDLIKKNAERFAKEFYKTDKPTAEQLQGAVAMLANTAQNLIDYNLGYDVPYFKQAESFLHTLQSEYASTDPTLSIGNGQYLFYATNDQKNSPYINSGYVDKEIAGVIIKAPIRKPEIPGENNSKRDPATNLPLDEEGRYAQQIVVDGKMHAPKYFPCPRASAGCGGQNLDMSDPGTAAYVKALDQKILNDIGTAATVVAIVNPVGAIGNAASVTGMLVTLASAIIDDPLVVGGAEVTSQAAQKYMQLVLKIPAATAIRITAAIQLSGGWGAFAKRMKTESTINKSTKGER